MLACGFRTMGCHARAIMDATGRDAREAIDALPGWFDARERCLSRFDPESDLARLNAIGVVFGATDVLWDAVDVALHAAAASDGLVTPTILPALEGAGYDRTFDGVAADADAPPSPAALADFRAIERDPRTRRIRLPHGVRLDLGGTAKGWSADIAARLLGRFGPAVVDVGGDIGLGGAAREPWPIAVGDPNGGEPLDIVMLARGGVATSGRDIRRWRRRGIEQHHVIDPRTGAPASTDVWTATVIAPSALEAEVAAKRVLLAGRAAGLAWIESRPDLAALVVRDDGAVVRSARFERYAWRSAA